MQRTNTNLMADIVENIGLNFYFKVEFSIHLVFHRYNIDELSIVQNYDCVIIKPYIFHQFDLQRLSGMNILCSLRERGGLKIDFEIGISIQCFDDVHNKLVSAHCTVTLNALTVTDENHKRCIFPNLPAS